MREEGKVGRKGGEICIRIYHIFQKKGKMGSFWVLTRGKKEGKQ